MTLKLKTTVKLILEAGKATPAPPIGPILGHFGINLMKFCKEYNDLTKDSIGSTIPIKILIYEDISYTILLRTPPTATLLLKEINTLKGVAKNISTTPKFSISPAQLYKIAYCKLKELNTNNIETAVKIITGTARSMGIIVL